MELTLDQALQIGVEAHKAGKAQEADQYYTAILKANPKHPDANHNMGALAVSVGKVEEALPFFKTALEANSSIGQYWLSYINALIKLDRIADAKAVLNQAKSNDLQGEGFDKLEQLLNKAQIEGDQTDEDILREAVDLRETGKYDEAIDLLLYKTKQSPRDPNILAVLSHCCILTDNLKQAKIYLDTAKGINSSIAAVGWNQARLLLKQKKVNEALAVAEKTNKLFPDDVEGMAVLGSCLRSSDRLKESLKYLNNAIELNPNCAEALINRGLIFFNKKDKSNALTDLEKAHKLKPHIKQIRHLVLNLKMEAKDFENTIALAEEMVKLDPADEKTFATIAHCYQHLKNYDDAVVFYNKALSIKPDYAEAWTNLGSALKDQGKSEEAIEAYTKALSIKPGYAEAYNNVGSILKDQGKLDQAVEAYKKALSIKPDYVEAYYNWANVLKDQGKLDQAVETYNKVLSIKADYAEAYNSMGSALRDQGELDQAVEAYNKALSIKPNYAEANYGLAAISYIRGDSKGVMANLRLVDSNASEFDSDKNFLRLPYKILTSLNYSNMENMIGLRKSKDLKNSKKFPFIFERNVEDTLIKCLYKLGNRGLDETNDARYGSGKCSPDFKLFETDEPIIKKVAAELLQSMEKLLNGKVLSHTSFFNILGAGGGSKPHDHLKKQDVNFDLDKYKFSLVYYLTVGDQDCTEPGILKLYEPDIDILPKKGMCVLIPASRKHSAIYNGSKDRMMIGCNFYLV